MSGDIEDRHAALATARMIGDLQAENAALRKRVAELERLKDLYLQTRNDLVEENDKLVEKSAKLQADIDALRSTSSELDADRLRKHEELHRLRADLDAALDGYEAATSTYDDRVVLFTKDRGLCERWRLARERVGQLLAQRHAAREGEGGKRG